MVMPMTFARVLIGAWHDRVAAVEDFAELTEEDVASITSGMTRVEAARFQAAVTRLQTAPNAGEAAQDDTEVRAPSTVVASPLGADMISSVWCGFMCFVAVR